MRRTLLATSFVAAGCCPTTTEPAPEVADGGALVAPSDAAPDGETWRQARAELEALRARFAPRRARTQHVKLIMKHEVSGRRLEARGAVAVGSDAGLRMILLGPGGTTALDLWVCGDDFRYQVPALEMERRGRVGAGAETGLPVGFLRWWFLDRLEGRLLSYWGERGSRRFVLRDGDQVLSVRGGRGLTVDRGKESLTAVGGDCGRARYHHAGLGLTIEVVCERVAEGAPPARAFADPDDPQRGCQEGA